MLYTWDMSKPPIDRTDRTSFSLRVGSWLEASATGWGVVAVPVVILLILGAALVRMIA